MFLEYFLFQMSLITVIKIRPVYILIFARHTYISCPVHFCCHLNGENRLMFQDQSQHLASYLYKHKQLI